MRLKYALTIAKIPACPPRSAVPRTGTFYRLLFEDAAHPMYPHNFHPPAAINPERKFRDERATAAA